MIRTATTAARIEREFDGQYARPSGRYLREQGGERISSSNDEAGSGGYSFSPDEQWRFGDGSILEVSYSYCQEQ
jgi:hypothetical protein